jgi:hypothetical protein
MQFQFFSFIRSSIQNFFFLTIVPFTVFGLQILQVQKGSRSDSGESTGSKDGFGFFFGEFLKLFSRKLLLVQFVGNG